MYAYKGEVGFKVSGDMQRTILRNYHRNIAAADKLTGLATKDALCAHLGGDEFAMMMRNLSKDESEAAADKVIGALQEKISIKGVRAKVSIGASYGIAEAYVDAGNVSDLLAKADAGMYKSKKSRLRLKLISEYGLPGCIGSGIDLNTIDLNKSIVLDCKNKRISEGRELS